MVHELTDADEQEIVCLMAARHNLRLKVIAQRFGVSIQTLYRVARRRGAQNALKNTPAPSRDDTQ